MTSNQFHGHDFLSIQPSLRAQQKIRIDTPVDTAAIDAWLHDCFGVEEAVLPAGAPPARGDGAGQARAAMERAFVLYSELLLAAGIPVFPEGRVLGVEAEDAQAGLYAIHFLLPALDNMPVSLFAGVLKEALRLVLGPLNTPPTQEAARTLLDELDRTVVRTLKDNSPLSGINVAVCGEAFRHRVPFRHLGRGMMRLGTGARSQLLYRSAVEGDSSIGSLICGQKQISASILADAGFPAAEHIAVTTAQEAVEAARKLGWPVVVKPEDRERSEGVTTNIRTEPALLFAFEQARKHSENVLVERHVLGFVHRIMVAGGQAIYAVKRLPKGVEGDGRRTVQELVDEANGQQSRRPPWKRLTPFPLDDLARACLSELGLTPQSVPDRGQWAALRPIASTADGGDVVNLTEEAHPDNIRLALDVARLLGLNAAGVDMMSTDLTRPWHENGAIVNEVNYNPAFTTSKREAHAARLIPALMESDGRIPVHMVTGAGNLLDTAQELKKRLKKKGRKCHLVSSRWAEDAQGRPVPLAKASLFDRSLALLLRPTVHELIVVATPEEVFAKGLAADRLESVWIAGADSARAERLTAEIRVRFPTQTLRRV